MYMIIPFVIFLIFGWHTNFRPLELENMMLGGIFVSLSVMTVLFASSRQVYFKPLFNIKINNRFIVSCFFCISIVFFTFSLILSESYGESFRHTGPNLSEAGINAIFHSVMKGATVAIFIIYIRGLLLSLKFNAFHRISSFIICMGYVVFPVAAFDAIYATMFLFFALGHAFSSKLLYMNLISGIIIGIPILLGIYLLGISTKVGFENTFEYFSESGLVALRYFQYRLSVFFFSAFIGYSSIESLLLNWVEGVSVTAEMILYRLELLFGLSPDRLIISNLNVLNFKNVFMNYDASMEIGASPGLILCFLYLAPFPLALFLLYFFVFGLSGILNSAFGKGKRSYFIVFCLITALHGIINNPIHVLTSIGPDMVKLLLIVFSLTASLTYNGNCNPPKK